MLGQKTILSISLPVFSDQALILRSGVDASHLKCQSNERNEPVFQKDCPGDAEAADPKAKTAMGQGGHSAGPGGAWSHACARTCAREAVASSTALDEMTSASTC
jgi:hypothetical protein